MNSALWLEIQGVLIDSYIPWGELQDGTVLVTGSTGLIGGLVVNTLPEASKKI
ncbi:MAG: hypothetical protein FWG02_09305 [Holophagaceae bacterium]|nr:hypothetical protein [Holophagaceae bacterium]